MRSSRARLLRDLGRLEKRLRRTWAAEAPPVPEELRSYRDAWLETLARRARPAGFQAMRQAILRGSPLVVGDFHPLGRARRYLALLLQELPEWNRPGLILELLPHPVVMTAEAAIRHPDLRLLDGRLAGEVYRPILRELARRGGMVAGAWTGGGPEERDASAATRWTELTEQYPGHQWILFFGDWHLADAHLPARLRAAGGRPTVLHQSPEPLWHRGRGPQREEILTLGGGHWAWLHTPPLTHWASALQADTESDLEYAAEISEHLVEDLAIHLAEVLDLPEPDGRPAVWPQNMWKEFRSALPAADRRALASGRPPAVHILHPHLPAGWFPRTPDLSALIEAAAHVLACESPLGQRTDFGGRIRARAFRRLWAAHLNPFLLPTDFRSTADLLFPGLGDLSFEREMEKLLRALESGRTPFLGARQRLLTQEVLGIRAGTRLAGEKRVDQAFVEEFLRTGGDSFSWGDLAATIRAA